MHLCVSCPLVHACRVFAQTVIPDDGDAAIVLKQVKAETDDDRSRIYRDAVVSAYAAAVIENELEKGDVPVPVKPAEGVGADSAYGPFYIYGRLGACRRFAEEVPVLVLDTPQVQLVVEVLDLSAEEKPSSGKVKISEKQMQSLFVHVGDPERRGLQEAAREQLQEGVAVGGLLRGQVHAPEPQHRRQVYQHQDRQAPR